MEIFRSPWYFKKNERKQGELSTREAFLRYIELLYEWKN